MQKLVKIFLTNTILFTSSLVFGQSLVYENYSTVLNSNLRETKILLNVPNIVYKEIKQDGKTFIQFEEQDFPLLYEIGKPELPFFTTFVAIPAKAGVDLQVKTNYSETLKNVVVFPSQNKEINEREGSYGVRNFDYDVNFYGQGTENFPKEDGNVGEPMILRNLRVVALRVYPFKYNPKLKQLEIAKQLEITLDYTSANPTNTLETEPTVVSRAFDELYKTTVINYQTLGTQTAPVSYYVIYAPLASHTTLQPLVDWKNQKGVKTILVDLGTIANSTALKTDITNRYNSPTPPDYVMIVGDESVTNAYKETYTPDPEPSPGAGSLPGNYSNDNYFVTVSGTDYFPDIFGSRIPIGSSGATNLTKIQRVVNKTLQYEKTPFINPNIDWYKRGVVAANDAYASQKDTKRKVRQKLLDYGNFTSVDTFYVENGAQKSQFIASFVSGVGYVNYRGEGWVDGWSAMNFGVSDANNLTLNGMTPIVTSIGCGVALFNGGSDCLGQALMFRGTGTNTGANLGGSVVFCGPTWNTHTSWNNKTDLGLYNAMFQLHYDNLSASYLYGKMYMFSILGDNITTETAFNQYLIFGDSEINIRTTTPKAVSILTSSTVVANSTLNVIVNETTGTPLKGIRICAYTSDGSVYFVDETNNVGELAIQVGNATLGSTLYVTVSGKNIIPVQQTYTITNPAQFVTFNQITIDDATNGNNNGKINPGETVGLGIVLHNYGTQTASNVVATLTTSDTLTTILQNSVSYGDISSGTVSQPPSNFIVQIDQDFVEYHAISFVLSITDGTNTWTEPINIALGTPSLVVESVIIEDNSTFHPNSLDPGETATIKVVLKNQGWGSAQNFNGILITGNSNVSVTDFNATYDLTLEPDSTGGSSISDAFQVTIPANFPIETSVEFTLYVASGAGSSYPYSFALPFNLTIGQLFSNDPSLADAYGYSMIENVDTNILEAPTFSWIEIATPLGGMGTQINFNAAISDQTLVQNLPFPFKFYGNTFNQISVSTDGFAMLGSNTANQWQNQDLPYADNLTNMVCPFWTDLWDNQNGESGRVYKYYDATNHLFIVEWYNLHHYSGTPNPAETFQIILKDPAFYVTPTGDGEIIFQYQNIDLIKQEYTTVGLENATQTIGIQYKGKNSIANSSAGIESGRAILFTTNPPTVVSAEDKNQVATNFKLAQNYPNPFNPSTKIDFSIPSREKVELEIFNVLGQQVKTLVSKSLPSGNHSILWNGTDKNGNLVSSGIYFYKIKAGDFTQTRKMTFLK